MALLLTYFVAYLLGSLSSAILVCSLLRLPDPRTQGSNNPGATNVLRMSGKKAAALVLIGDVGKGVVAILLARYVLADNFYLSFVLAAVVLGHMFPIFFRLQGGKGVATYLGAITSLNPYLGFFVLGIWLLVFAITRYSSLAALLGIISLPVLCLLLPSFNVWFIAVAVTGLFIVIRHQQNILRLCLGQEPKSRFFK